MRGRCEMAYVEISPEEETRYETAYDLIKALRGCGVTFRVVDGKLRYRPADKVNELGKAELKRCKAEVIELLQDEAEAEAEWEARLANQPETDPMPDAEYEAFTELPTGQQNMLFDWIEESFEPALETEANLRDSYGLKHTFERSPEGFYVTDEQFRAAMWLSGYLGRRYPGRRYEDCESRYYYVRPNIHGFHRKLVAAGVPSEWAWDVLFRRCPVHDENARSCHAP
jgi:hypothetical protein